ncbi:zinc metalloprotease [Thermaurantimonas aggregans]|uniref:Zinc metalloprotease n=1 Tax=Thermaurantimonas aggregans TaxID=2173829 RepID=A0A401XJT6_9FLAO|nr:RIP metalloprotease RseP [Thermaurantimonas aggregans]MCX8148906.1 RIP metalloprotease RseP [Thermaurantimonas aggregans]GCD77279.1 zinc metalloprotease [Thermaurantimonas aggregans]
MDLLVRISQFLLSLSILIILHELGHFIPAKLFKTRVEKFYLFFNPWFSLFKKKIGETEYGIGWLPLGGYVKISGMIDESMDTEQMKQPPQPYEFRSKPAWQRLIIMVGGVTVNVLLAIVIYMGMLMYYGEEYIPTQNVKYGIVTDSIGTALGFKNGDKILSVNGKYPERFHQIPLEILLSGGGYVEVERSGKPVRITITEEKISDIIKSKSTLFGLRFPYYVGGFVEDSEAKKAGLQEGDQLVGINDLQLQFFDQYLEEIPKHKGDTVILRVNRASNILSIPVYVPESGKIGVFAQNPSQFFETKVIKYGFLESIGAAFSKAATMLSDYIRQFKIIFNPKTEAYKEVGGFIMIAKQFDTTWNWEKFWSFTAFLSIMLAFLNILPIPALDGGHVVFLLWEILTGKPASQKVLEYAQLAGFFILLGLLILANSNDIIKLF